MEEPTITTTVPAASVEGTAPAPAPEAAAPPPADGATAPAETTPAEPKPDISGRRFAALAARERQARAQAEQIAVERAALKADREAAEAYRAALAAAKDDPLAFIQKHLNLDFETLARRHVLKEPVQQEPAKVDPVVAELKAELEALKAERGTEKEQAQKQAELEAKQAQQQIIDEHLTERLTYAKEHADDFEMVLANQAPARDMYLGLYNQAFLAKNQLPLKPTQEQLQASEELTPDECIAVMGRVEQLLTEEAEKLLLALSGSKRFGSRFAPKPADVSKEPQAARVATPTSPAMTLTNDARKAVLVSDITKVTTSSSKPETEEEMIARVRSKFPPKVRVA